MVISVIPMRGVTSACWLCRGKFSINVSPVAVCARTKLAVHKTQDNKATTRTLCMESSFSLPSWIRQPASQKSGLESYIDKTHSDAVALRRMTESVASAEVLE